MSIWQRIKRRLSSDEPAPTSVVSAPVASTRPAFKAEPPRLETRLVRFGEPGGPSEDEVLDALRRSRGTEDETKVLGAVLSTGDRMTEPVRVACAVVLVARGEEDRALEVLTPCRSPAALMLAADLFAGRGETARALGSVERVLAKDLGAPGAMERHAKWSSQLGATIGPVKRLDEVTMVAATPADTPYRIDREVARGGAGSVYEAYDEILLRKVAFKSYHGGAEDRVAVEREVRLATRFSGPGIIRVFDASPEAGWVALEWATQGSLREWVRAHRVDDLFPVARWALPLVRALARVHAAGFVHADVKPTNVLLNDPSTPLLSDFGIARPVGAKAAGGSAGYVSPERLAGSVAAFEDDVYGFGRTLDDVLSICPERTTPALDRLVSDCLAPVGKRPPDARAVVERLAALGSKV